MFKNYFTKSLLETCQKIAEEKSATEAVLADIKSVVDFVSNGDETSLKNSSILRDSLKNLCGDFMVALNSLDREFYGMNFEDRSQAVSKIWKDKSGSGMELANVLTNFNYQEITRSLQSLLEVAFDSPYLVVQTPVEMDQKLKKEINKQLVGEFDMPVIVKFQVNKAILGGMRIFRNGQVEDKSWMGRIEKIANLKI